MWSSSSTVGRRASEVVEDQQQRSSRGQCGEEGGHCAEQPVALGRGVGGPAVARQLVIGLLVEPGHEQGQLVLVFPQQPVRVGLSTDPRSWSTAMAKGS